MKKKAFVTLGVVFGLSASMFAMLPSATRTEAAVPVIDKTNIEHAWNTLQEAIKIYTTDYAQLKLLVENAQKIDPRKIAEYELNVAMQKQQNNDSWCHISYELPDGELPPVDATPKELLEWYKKHAKVVKNFDGELTGIMDTGKEWGRYLGDVNAILNGKTSIQEVVMNEKKRQQALNQTMKSVADEAQKTQQSNQAVLADTQKELASADDPNASMTQIMQHTAHIDADQTLIMLNGFSMIGKALQAEAAHYAAENARNAEQEENTKLMLEKASKDAEAINVSKAGQFGTPYIGE